MVDRAGSNIKKRKWICQICKSQKEPRKTGAKATIENIKQPCLVCTLLIILNNLPLAFYFFFFFLIFLTVWFF